MTCGGCGVAAVDGARFCMGCGETLAQVGNETCQCGAVLTAGARFCRMCGRAIGETVVVVEIAAAATATAPATVTAEPTEMPAPVRVAAGSALLARAEVAPIDVGLDAGEEVPTEMFAPVSRRASAEVTPQRLSHRRSPLMRIPRRAPSDHGPTGSELAGLLADQPVRAARRRLVDVVLGRA